MYHIYILKSKSKAKTYTGMTSDVARRFEEHNSEKVISSRRFRPYDVVHVEESQTEKAA